LRAVADAPAAAHIRERALDLLYRHGDLESVARLLAERPAGSDARPETAKFLALAASEAGDLRGSVEPLQRASAARPDVPEYRHRLAQALIRDGRKGEAAEVAAERARLTEAREALRLAWNDLATAYEADSRDLDPRLLERIAAACTAAALPREAEAWSVQAERIRRLGSPQPATAAAADR
jgi:hypothetical protein